MERHDLNESSESFRIWVHGRLDARFADGLDGVVQKDAPDGTRLSGEFVDRSHLYGILDHLRGLGVDILRFEVDPPSRRPLEPD